MAMATPLATMRSRRRGRRTLPAALLLALILLLLTILQQIPSSNAERDGNAPWGDGKPPRGFDMWWSDPSNVLEDLDQFSALYIKVHGCVWSEYGIDNFDDDGENRDGDEDWYQGRTQPFRANAAYSLYGVLKGQFRARKCSKSTYINTFVTNMGADTILEILGRDTYASVDDDGGYGHASCTEAGYDEYRWMDRDRELGSGDNDNGYSVTTTMGCSLTGDDFVMATFDDSYCDGNYFANTTDLMSQYNHAMDRVKCEKVWPSGSDSGGDTLLETSSACDNNFYQSRCPDPYGRKKRYAIMVSGGNNRKKAFGLFMQRTSRLLSWILLVVGVGLLGVAFYYRRRFGRKGRKKKKKKRRSKSRSSRRVGRSTSGMSDADTGTDRDGESSPRRSKKSGSSRRERQQEGESEYYVDDVDDDDQYDHPDVTSAMSSKSARSSVKSGSRTASSSGADAEGYNKKSSSSSSKKKKKKKKKSSSSDGGKHGSSSKFGFESQEEYNHAVSGEGEIV